MVAKILSVDCENLIEIASRVFDWFGSFRTSLCAIGDGQTDRQTSSLLKATYRLCGTGLKN